LVGWVGGRSYSMMLKRGKKVARRKNAARRSNGITGQLAAGHVSVAPMVTLGPIHRFNRSTQLTLAAAAADKGYSYNFALSDVPNYTEFTGIFTQWRLKRVQIDMTWLVSVNANPTSTPQIYYSVDPFATTAPGTLATMIARPYKTFVFGPNSNMLTIQADLKSLSVTQSGPGAGSTLGLKLSDGGWLDCAQPQIAYGNLIFWLQNFNTGGEVLPVINVVFRHEFEFRGSTTGGII